MVLRGLCTPIYFSVDDHRGVLVPIQIKSVDAETLNIEWHVKHKVLSALNKYRHDARAADALGIHVHTVFIYKRRFNIERCPVTKEYSFKEKI